MEKKYTGATVENLRLILEDQELRRGLEVLLNSDYYAKQREETKLPPVVDNT